MPIEEPDNVEWNEERVNDRVSSNGGTYSGSTQDHIYDYDPGVVAMPLASRDPKMRVIRLHGGFQTRKINWSATRGGKPPLIPAAKDMWYDKLIGATVILGMPVADPQSNGYNWAASGSYLYVEAAPRVPGTHTLPTGYPGYTTGVQETTAAERYDSSAGAIQEGIQAIVDAGPDETPIAPIDVVARIVSGDNPDGADQSWPFTFISPIFTTDTGFDT